VNENIKSFIEHLDELRGRLLKSLIAVIVCSIVVYNFGDAILAVLERPVGKLIYIGPSEAFITYIKVALWGGLFLASPICLYQLWCFIGSGLHENERRMVYSFIPVSFVLFIVGAVFGVFVILNFGMQFLLSFGAGVLTPMISVSKYVSFVGAMAAAFGVVFQLPLVMLLLTKTGLATPELFIKKRKIAIVLIFIAAGVLTPGPDLISQFSMAIPLLVLYEVGIVLSKLAYKSVSSVIERA
jgi:sec-independent protein translocase protein TatC